MHVIKKMSVTSFEGKLYEISFDNRADLCWSVNLGLQDASSLLRSNDKLELTPDGNILRSGSLERVLGIIGNDILKCEC